MKLTLIMIDSQLRLTTDKYDRTLTYNLVLSNPYISFTGIPAPNVSVSDSYPAPGDTIEFKCTCYFKIRIELKFIELIDCCTSTSGPRALSYHWIKDGIPVVPGVRHQIVADEKQSILTIRKIDPIDEGNYQCIVR